MKQMPIENWMGEREVSGQNAEVYKNKVIEVLSLDGYLLIKNSSDTSGTADIIFKKPYTEGDIEIWIETKYADVSLSDKDFLTELARYFINYLNKDEKFDLYFFIRKCKNWPRWRHVFDNTLYQQEEVTKLYNIMKEKAKLQDIEKKKILESTFFNFESFITDCYVHQVNYDGLLMKIEKYKTDNKRFSAEKFYTRELGPLNERSTVTGNFIKVIKLPEKIYYSEVKELTRYEDIFYDNIYYKSYWLKWGKMFSLYPLESSSDDIYKYIDPSTNSFFFTRDWIKSDKKSKIVISGLIKKHILETAVNKGCIYVEYKGHNLMFTHPDLSEEHQYVEGKLVSRCFKEANPVFVKHIAIKVNVKSYNDDFHIVLSPIILFTKDGINLITGEKVKRLHEIFTPNKFENNPKVFGDIKWWFSFLNLNGKINDEKPIVTSDMTTLELPVRPPKNSDERDKQVTNLRLEELYEF